MEVFIGTISDGVQSKINGMASVMAIFCVCFFLTTLFEYSGENANPKCIFQ